MKILRALDYYRPKNRLKFLIVVLVILLAIIAVGCNEYAGMYVDPDGSGAWIELKGDGTFEAIFGLYGRWDVEGNQLTLIHALGLETYIIEDGKIMSHTGKVLWVKR